MDFKISVKCGKCSCKFELRPQDFKERDAIECPNCGQAFPDDVYSDLKAGIKYLGRVPDTIDDRGIENFAFKLDVCEYSIVTDLFHTN